MNTEYGNAHTTQKDTWNINMEHMEKAVEHVNECGTCNRNM